MIRRSLTVVVLLPILVSAASLLGSVPSAAATTRHWDAGTYQVFTFEAGTTPATVVLSPDHILNFPGSSTSGTWTASTHDHVVTISVSYQVPLDSSTLCLFLGQPPLCFASFSDTGPKTPTGIATPEEPGQEIESVGSNVLASLSFWAVRTGPAHR